MRFSPAIGTLTVDKVSAAARQAEAAINAFEQGDYDVAITLAGAAEGMLPTIDGQDLFSLMRDHPHVPSDYDKRTWISVLNADRDWLKHTTIVLGNPITITPSDAGFMILRALAKIPEWSDRMIEFKEWAMANLYT